MDMKVYNLEGKEVGEITLNPDIFEVEYNEALIHQVIVAQLANKRQGTKSALTRTEVSGGGIKPWRQKGTGRARQGSTRSPQWRHGGVVFAPKPRDFSKKINKRMKLGAFYSALSQKIRQEELVVLENLAVTEPKTKEMSAICGNLKAGKNAVFITGSYDAAVVRASRNLADAQVETIDLVSVYQLVRAGKVFITKEAVTRLEEVTE